MPSLRASLVASFAAFLTCGALGACSSSTDAATSAPAPADAAADVDAALGPMLCGLPVASTCALTPPCTFSAWGCTQAACDGYEVITDGTWTYFYSLPGGELAGEVSSDDAGVEACPYGFQPPTGCVAAVAPSCASGATTDGG